MAALAGAAGRRRAPEALRSYDAFLCYSRFAQEWIARRIGVRAEVVPPPVDPPAEAPPTERRRRILGVGRFFRGAHAKRHDVLIEAFRALDAEGWELHLAGAADELAQTEGWVPQPAEDGRGPAGPLPRQRTAA